MKKIFYFLPIFFICLILTACISNKPQTCTITYHIFDETNRTIEQNYKKNEVISSSYFDATKEGYEPSGWYHEEDFANAVVFPYTVTKNEDFYLKWEEKTVTITLVKGENQVEENTYPINKKFEKPADPVKDGHIFKGWSTNASTFEAWDFDTLVTSNLTLYAFFEVKSYTITYVVEDTTSTETVAHGNKITKKDPIIDGYAFIGWSTDSKEYKAFNLDEGITKDTTLYAFFQIKTYKVTFTIDGKSTIETIEHGSNVVKPTDPTKTGYQFVGWYHNDIKYEFNNPVTSDITLIAKFDINTYTVSFNKGSDTLTTASVNHNTKVERPENPNIIGSRFINWYQDENLTVLFDFDAPITENITIYGKFEDVIVHTITLTIDDATTTKKVNDGDCLIIDTPIKTGYTFQYWTLNGIEFDLKTAIIQDLTLVAVFKINSYTVTFKNDTEVKTVSTDYNTTIEEPVKPNKEGYTFEGWYNGIIRFDFTTPITSNLTLTAKYSLNTYIVTFQHEDGSIIDQKEVKYKQMVAINNPVKEGYTFIGWYNGSVKFELSTLITENLILTAKFEQVITYTVTFKIDSDVQTVKVEKGSLVKQPENPTKEGFSFVGWFDEDIKFDFTTPIESNITLTAKFEESILKITSSSGYNEGLYIEFEKLNNVSLTDYNISYKLSSSTSYIAVDKELIREKDNIIRCDIVGLPKGTYDVQIAVEGKTLNQSFNVAEDDRSGYAHFGNTSGIGAYTNDGSLKNNAVVVYVSDETKNTVTAKIGSKTYTGLVNIIKACTSSSYALDVRILGEIQTTQWNKKSHGTGNTSARQTNLENTFKYTTDSSGWDETSSSNYSKLNEKEIISKGINSMSDDLASGITQLNGLTNQVFRNKKTENGINEYDSYYNMLDVSGCKNITIEGIGTDAAIFQWGFAFKKCDSIEVKNIRFYNYTEDAVGFEGGSSSNNDFGYYWVHNCTFDLGVNNWDVCYEADKGDGDGSTDVKYCHNVTISYTQYNGTHKTNLIGSSDSALQYNITLHHNFYNKAGSRLPLVRQANIHIYNNYYYGSTSYSHSIRANCYAFVENNYYDGGKNPYEVVSGGVIKAYNNTYNNVTTSGSYKKVNTVTSRTQTVSSTCKPDGSTDYSNFDTNSKLFYYDTNKKVSDVKNLLETTNVPEHCKTYSGVLKANAKGLPGTSTEGDKDPDPIIPPIEEDITWNNVVTQDFSSSIQIEEIDYNAVAPTEAGFYYSYNTSGTDTGSTATNNMKVENGMLKINDTSKVATFGYYIFDQNYNTGKVRISLDFIPQKSSGSWTMIHFLDGQSNLGIRTNTDKVLGYTTDGSAINPISSKAMEANKTYTIILIIDYDKGVASIEINGETITFNYSNAITGIMFQTANADTSRSFSIDNIAIDVAN